MASERELELLDGYLSNKLSTTDKVAFEKSLQSDGALNKEYLLQKHVVEGIKNARVTELKQLLNNVPLSSIPQEGPSVLMQAGTWLLVAGLVGTGLYFFLRDDKIETTPVTSTEEVARQPDQVLTPKDEPKLDPTLKDSQIAAQPKAEVKEQPSAANTSPEASDVTKAEEKSVAPGARDVFDPGEETKSSGPAAAEVVKSSTAVTPSIAMETLVDSKYKFHYQFRENKLFLYGVFEKNLYEIMEFFSNNKRTMFLFYKDSYYLLNEDNDTVKPLAPITDPTLLKKLKDYRAGR